jgi:RNA polymerase sigma-70 factor (ECF subfamily)
MDALAPGAVLIADGGGVVAAVRQPVVGARKIVNLLGGFARVAPAAVVEPVLLNGAPGAWPEPGWLIRAICAPVVDLGL